ncbi:MAG: Mur ligase family protein [Bacteroidota bacterium]
MKVHFIAIGGSAMHNLAIALKNKGAEVTGSDDEIFEPSKSRLTEKGILPDEIGWFPGKIHSGLDAVILGMHAREDNPELLKAKALGLPVYSYPEYLYNQTREKTRVVIGGSHGKTTITSMILHVLAQSGIEADYMVGAQLEGFDCMVRLSETAKVAVLEGDEYLSSPIDRRPKFHLYHPDVALLSGIAWDHINVFPTYDYYVDQFRTFINLTEKNGQLIYCEADADLVKLAAEHSNPSISYKPYNVHPHVIRDGSTWLQTAYGEIPLEIFGDHNLQNLSGAKLVCLAIGVGEEQFYKAISSFKGASKRLELVHKTDNSVFYKDFAHSPSKLKATTAALKQQFPNRKLVACMELHTFSSLNKTFLSHYEGAMEKADRAIVYYNPHTLEHKRLPSISPQEVREAFGGSNVEVFTDASDVREALSQENWNNANLLMMTSGTFDGIDFKQLGKELFGGSSLRSE